MALDPAKIRVLDRVIYRGRTYTFTGFISAICHDGQVVVQAENPGALPSEVFNGMKHIYSPSQLNSWWAPNMSKRNHIDGDSEIEIDCEIVSDIPGKNAIAITTGVEEVFAGMKKLKWFWIPRLQCEIRDDSKAILVKRWVAEEKGLV